MKRGDVVRTGGGGVGWYVGTTRGGVVWVAYAEEDFEPMCRAFDARAQ